MSKSLSILLTLFSIPCGRSVAGGYWDEQFGVPGACPGGVQAVVVLEDTIVVGGNFLSIGGIAATNLAQWDGAKWAQIGGGVPDGFVFALSVVGGSNLFVAGAFNQVGGLIAHNIARWDGTNWSTLGEGVNDVVFALASDGQNIYAGGHFTTAGTNQVGKVARWDGRNWSGLGLGILDVGIRGRAFCLAVSEGSLYVGGIFRVAGETGATNIARWDGTAWYGLGSGLRFLDYSGAENGAVRALAVAGGTLYAGGDFKLAGIAQATNIASWDGEQWSAMNRGVDGIGTVSSLTLSGSDLFVGGSFTNIGGERSINVARWNGRTWSALDGGIGEFPNFGEGVSGLASTGSELIAVGAFTSAGGLPSTNIALWHIPHELTIQRSADQVKLSWPGTGSNFVLETCSSLAQAAWQPVPLTPQLENDEWVVANTLGSSNELYRLRRR